MEERLYTMEGAEDTSLVLGTVLAVSIAALGGVVNWLRRSRKKNMWSFVAATLTAAFTGLLSHLLSSWLGLPPPLQYAIAGAAGYGGGTFLDQIVPRLTHMLHRKIPDGKQIE